MKIRDVGRRVRFLGPVAVALGVLAATVVGLPRAHGASVVDVRTSGLTFSPPDVTIAAGDTVRWTRTSGTHNVHILEDGTTVPGPPSDTWDTVTHTFDQPGTYHYVCDLHQDLGMVGTVTVQPVATPTPTPTPPPAPTPTPPPGGGAPPPPQLRSVAVTRVSFCTRRSRSCRRPGVVLAIDLSAPASVRGTLRRAALHGRARYRSFGTVDFGQVAAGRQQLRFSRAASGRRLSAGRYRLVLSAAGTTSTLRFRVRPS
jgi:plastocyanin